MCLRLELEIPQASLLVLTKPLLAQLEVTSSQYPHCLLWTHSGDFHFRRRTALHTPGFPGLGSYPHTCDACTTIYATYLVNFNYPKPPESARLQMLCLWAESIRKAESSLGAAAQSEIVVLTHANSSLDILCHQWNVQVVPLDLYTELGRVARMHAYHQFMQHPDARGKHVVFMYSNMLLLRNVQEQLALGRAHYDLAATWRPRSPIPRTEPDLRVNPAVYLVPATSRARRWVFALIGDMWLKNYKGDAKYGEHKTLRDLLGASSLSFPDISESINITVSVADLVRQGLSVMGAEMGDRKLRLHLASHLVLDHDPPLRCEQHRVAAMHFQGSLKVCMGLYMDSLRREEALPIFNGTRPWPMQEAQRCRASLEGTTTVGSPVTGGRQLPVDPVQAGTKLEPKKTVPATVTSEKQASGETLDRPPGESAAMHAQKAVDASFAAKMAADTAMQASNMSASLVQLAESNMNLIGIETRAEAVNDEAAESRNMSQRLSWADQAADGAGSSADAAQAASEAAEEAAAQAELAAQVVLGVQGQQGVSNTDVARAVRAAEVAEEMVAKSKLFADSANKSAFLLAQRAETARQDAEKEFSALTDEGSAEVQGNTDNSTVTIRLHGIFNPAGEKAKPSSTVWSGISSNSMAPSRATLESTAPVNAHGKASDMDANRVSRALDEKSMLHAMERLGIAPFVDDANHLGVVNEQKLEDIDTNRSDSAISASKSDEILKNVALPASENEYGYNRMAVISQESPAKHDLERISDSPQPPLLWPPHQSEGFKTVQQVQGGDGTDAMRYGRRFGHIGYKVMRSSSKDG
eukprot:CAMPEP_0114289380 /NCGR_PEP_ID=MMETSP0059-20121206/7341_1 /TAXON_ID=36894 /ORGANISM="Pyramimonas parkeae, Strain CCMP726" /LENGTH=810 /DNA_ID=CAMNT_0001410645 /DNA_START=400 /DNA_END=2833 /DNA_ORIENTATION=+